jgi:hypothetical protein
MDTKHNDQLLVIESESSVTIQPTASIHTYMQLMLFVHWHDLSVFEHMRNPTRF